MDRPYRVSTITCIGTIGAHVNLPLFFERLKVTEGVDAEEQGFVWAEMRNMYRGVHPRRKMEVKKQQKTVFDNQVTVVYRLGVGYMPSVKLFRNGKIQMTGIRNETSGTRMIEIMADTVRGMGTDVATPEEIAAGGFKISMINSDFSVPYEIRRKSLYHLLVSPEYQTICSFQGTYPAVKLQFFWNRTTHDRRDGRCYCQQKCFGKGIGDGDGQCKKVTVSVFESGNVLITGANAFDQVDDAYAFIRAVFARHEGLIQKVAPGAVRAITDGIAHSHIQA